MTPEEMATATEDQPTVVDTPQAAADACASAAPPEEMSLVAITQEGSDDEGSGMAEAWKEVGNQLAALGTGLAAAFRTGWKNEESRRRLKDMKGGLETMVNELGAAIREGAATPEAQKVKDEAGRTMGTVRSAGERTVQEIRPRITAVLEDLNEEVRKLAARMKKEGETAEVAAEQEAKTTPPGDSGGPAA